MHKIQAGATDRRTSDTRTPRSASEYESAADDGRVPEPLCPSRRNRKHPCSGDQTVRVTLRPLSGTCQNSPAARAYRHRDQYGTNCVLGKRNAHRSDPLLPFRSTPISCGLNSPPVSMLGLCMVRRLIARKIGCWRKRSASMYTASQWSGDSAPSHDGIRALSLLKFPSGLNCRP